MANDEVVFSVLQAAGRYDKPVVLNAGHLRAARPTRVRDIASHFPKISFGACNGGQINLSGMLQFEAWRPVPTSSSRQPARTARTFKEITTKVGEDRVLFASRSPTYDQAFEMARVRFAHLSTSQKQKLWG